MTVRTAADRARRLERQILVATRHENGDGVDTWRADLERKLVRADAQPWVDLAPERE